MAKAKRKFVCQQCGTVTSRWQGQCEDCGEWNSIVEEAGETVFSARHDLQNGGRAITLVGLDSAVELPPRTSTGAGYDSTAVLAAMIHGLLSGARGTFAAEPLREDKALGRLIGLEAGVPEEATVWRALGQWAERGGKQALG